MLRIKGYNLYSFAIGCKHVRAFAVLDSIGTIADFVLGECGAHDSPLPPGFYDKVNFGPQGVEVLRKKGLARFLATRDKVVMGSHTAQQGDDLQKHHESVMWAKHLFPMVYKHLRSPRLVFIGMVWEFVQADAPPRERYRHPAAEKVWKQSLKVPLDLAKEYPAEGLARIVFRKRIREVLVKDSGVDDYINVILTFWDAESPRLWAGEGSDEEEAPDHPKHDEPRVSLISVDLQRIFDPRRELVPQMIDSHWTDATNLLEGRIKEILGLDAELTE